MAFAERSLAIDVLDRSLRGVVGLVAGTVVGAIAAVILGTLLAIVWTVPKIWTAYVGCAAGMLTGTWSAVRCRWPWFTPVANSRSRRRPAAAGNGWVDLVVRSVLGVFAGGVAGGVVAGALLVWFEAFAVEIATEPEGYGVLLLFVLGLECGMLGGFLWFALDLPWFPGHRRPRERLVPPAP